MAYRCGQLDKRIRIFRDMRLEDGMGGCEITPTVVARVWAKYRNKSTRELLQAQQVQSVGTGVFVIRNRKDLFPTDYIVMQGRLFKIAGIPPYDPVAIFMEIDVENGVAN